MSSDSYQPVPVSAAERVATKFEKDVCVIVCYDRRHQKTHTTCFGKTPNDKVAGAALGKILSAAAGANVDRKLQRDIEAVDKHEFALWVQFLQSAAAKALAQLTGVQSFAPGEVARELHAALRVSEYADENALDAAAVAMMRAAKG
jgi:hypothetical protein